MTLTMPQFELHDYMRKALDSSGLGVGEMAARLDVSRDTVGRWINGRTMPSTPVLIAFAQLTNVDYDWLVCARRDSNPQPSDWESGIKQDDPLCFACGGPHDLDDCPTMADPDDAIARLLEAAAA